MHFAILTNAEFKILARASVSQKNLIVQGLWVSTIVLFKFCLLFCISKHMINFF